MPVLWLRGYYSDQSNKKSSLGAFLFLFPRNKGKQNKNDLFFQWIYNSLQWYFLGLLVNIFTFRCSRQHPPWSQADQSKTSFSVCLSDPFLLLMSSINLRNASSFDNSHSVYFKFLIYMWKYSKHMSSFSSGRFKQNKCKLCEFLTSYHLLSSEYWVNSTTKLKFFFSLLCAVDQFTT